MSRYLSRHSRPSDLKPLSVTELQQVAAEIRQAILDNLSQTGGHFASSLGAADLIVALHATYNVPHDKLIWDVGHQCYPHKILTGRLEAFPTLRQFGGISGFLRRDESEYDLYGAGHASTAISAAYGFAVARDMLNSSEQVIAVIGDAGLTGGLAIEGLLNAGYSGRNFTVVLNDNAMSIAENVGALAEYLGQARQEGNTSFGCLFEAMGFSYVGPVDGHDMAQLMDTFQQVRQQPGPVLVHVLTQKGKGYTLSEQDPRGYHAVTTFDPTIGQTARKAAPTYTSVFAETLLAMAQEDPRIVGITAGMPDGTGLARFQQQFPDRYFDAGIAEQHAVCFAAGLAAAGQRPVVGIYSTFLQRAYDLIVHDVALQNLPVLFAIDRAGLVGEDGGTHHGAFDLSSLRHIPNLTLAAPKDGEELEQMLRFSLAHLDGEQAGPIAVRYPRGSASTIDWGRESMPIELGKAEVLMKGNDITLVAIGSMVAPAFAAGLALRQEGIQATVINARFVAPLDEATILEAARRTGRVMVMEENVRTGGFGSAVLEGLAAHNRTDVQVRLLGIPDRFIEHGAQDILKKLCGLTVEHFVQTAREMVGRTRIEQELEQPASGQAFLRQINIPFPSQLNPLTKRMEEETFRWAQEWKLVQNETAIERFCAGKLSGLAGQCSVGGHFESLCIANEWIAWLTMLDDQCDETELHQHPDAMRTRFDSLLNLLDPNLKSPVHPNGPLACALHDLWVRTLRGMHPEWAQHFRQHVEECLDGCVSEARVRCANALPCVQEYIRNRRKCSGVQICLDLIYRTDQLRWNREVYEHPILQEMFHQVNDVVSWTNDIASHPKEVAHGFPYNLITTLQYKCRLTGEQANVQAVRMINEAVQHYLALERQLPSFGPKCDRDMLRMQRALRAWMRGNLDWSAETDRYKCIYVVPEGQSFPYLEALLAD